MPQRSFREELWEKIIAWYLVPAQFLIVRLCSGPWGLSMVLPLLIFVPPIFWTGVLSILIFALGWLVGRQ